MKPILELAPVVSSRAPRVPTRPEIDKHPELLHSVPQRWTRNAAVLAAMSSLVTLTAASQLVAPLFYHGKGRGGYGCFAVNAPVFLSEADARALIADEARKSEIDMIDTTTLVPGVMLDSYKDGVKQQPEKLTLDGFDTKKNIGFVFISVDDADKWGDPMNSMMSQSDAIAVAEKLRKKFQAAKPEMTIGVFYDPMPIRIPDRVDAVENITGREELRQQVRDFVKWLKRQGVI